jgi:hypothetical protein
MTTLTQLHVDIDTRVDAICEDNFDWLCGLSYDGCCHRLSEIPLLIAAEWDLPKEGLAALPPEQFEEIGHDIAALTE